MSRRPQSAGQLDAQVRVWNENFPIGTAVIFRRDSGETVETVTRSKAEVLGGHSAVVWLEGVSGCYLLDRVLPAPVAPA